MGSHGGGGEAAETHRGTWSPKHASTWSVQPLKTETQCTQLHPATASRGSLHCKQDIVPDTAPGAKTKALLSQRG